MNGKLEYLLITTASSMTKMTFKVLDGGHFENKADAERILMSHQLGKGVNHNWLCVVSANRYHAVITTTMETLKS